MKFLDTNILSYFLKNDAVVTSKFAGELAKGEEIAITSVTVYEIIKGFKRESRPKKEKLFEEFLKNVKVCHLDGKAIYIAADIYARLCKKGTPLDTADIFIAAIVLRNDSTLVTNNTEHFNKIPGLRLSNWLTNGR